MKLNATIRQQEHAGDDLAGNSVAMLERRLARCERRCRRLGGGLIALVGAGLAMGVGGAAEDVHRGPGEHAKPSTVVARQFVLVDATGCARGGLRVDEDGGAEWFLSDRNGRRTIAAKVTSDGEARLNMDVAAVNGGVELVSGRHGGGLVRVRGPNGLGEAALEATAVGNRLIIYNDMGLPCVSLRALPFGRPPKTRNVLKARAGIDVFAEGGIAAWISAGDPLKWPGFATYVAPGYIMNARPPRVETSKGDSRELLRHLWASHESP